MPHESTSSCAFLGCKNPPSRGKLCGGHRMQQRRGKDLTPLVTQRDPAAYFRDRVDQSGGPDACWPWTAGREKLYGRVKWRGRMWLAHRVAWILAHGPIPLGEGHHGTCVLHRCDTPLCCNPAHLFLGTQIENIRDRDQKGRHRAAVGERNGTHTHPERVVRGDVHPNAKLTVADVLDIRRRAAAGEPKAALARAFGVSPCTIRNVVVRRTWAHVQDEP